MTATFTLIQRHKSRGIKTWYIRTCENGRDSYKSTKTTVKATALKVFADYVKEQECKIRPKETEEIIISDEAARWLEIQQNRFGTDSNTFRLYRGNVNRLLQFLDEKRIVTFNGLDRNVAQDFANRLMTDRMKPSSIEITLRVSKLFVKWIIENNELTIRSPFQGVARPKVENHIAEFWTSEQCDSIIEHCHDKYWKAFFGLQCYAGLRFCEARKICVEDINGDVLLVKQDKTKKDSIIPIAPKLKTLLDAVVDGQTSGKIFEGKIGQHHSIASKYLKRAVIEAGLEGAGRVFNHRLRHSFASNLLRGGANMKSVQVLGRWSNPKILLKHYAGVIDDDLIKAVNSL